MDPGDERRAARVEFLGLHFDPLTLDEAVQAVVDLAGAAPFSYVVTPNVDHMVRLDREMRLDPDGKGATLARAYREAELCLCDSRILSWLAGASDRALPVAAGSDLTARLIGGASPSAMSPPATRVALLGGSAEQLAWLRRECPSVEWLQHIPPMGLLTNPAAQQEAIAFVEQAGAAFVLFTVGSPQSELLAAELRRRGRAAGVGLCLGASIEFVTGEKRRAPRLVNRLGLEWAFRLATEPRRLWRRYLVEGPRIFRIWRAWNAARRASRRI